MVRARPLPAPRSQRQGSRPPEGLPRGLPTPPTLLRGDTAGAPATETREGAEQSSALAGVDPGQGDDQPDHPEKEQDLHPDRQPDQPPRPPRPRAAALAVGGVRDELRPAGVAGELGLLHSIEYVCLRSGTRRGALAGRRRAPDELGARTHWR